MAGPKGTASGLRGVSNIKTASKIKIHSKPKTPGQEYLDMYLAIKDKERLERYKETLERSHGGADEQLKEVQKELEKLGKIVGKFSEEDIEEMQWQLEKRKLEKSLDREKKQVLENLEKKMRGEQKTPAEIRKAVQKAGFELKPKEFKKRVPDKPFSKMDLGY